MYFGVRSTQDTKIPFSELSFFVFVPVPGLDRDKTQSLLKFVGAATN